MDSGFIVLAWLQKTWPFIFLLATAKMTENTAAAANNTGFISIDCGAPQNYTESGTGLYYISDATLIDTGTIQKTQLLEYKPKYHYVRSFPQGKRNCYTLKPSQGKGTNYLIRAGFYYGNFDGENRTPRFDLHIGVNLWASIYGQAYNREIIYKPTTDHIDVCLVKTGDSMPYISFLELRPLASSIYQTNNIDSLSLKRRLDLAGYSSSELRYPHDSYDRIWSNYTTNTWIRLSTGSMIKQSGDYKLPISMLMTAAATATQNSSIPLVFSYSVDVIGEDTELYFCVHFAEVEIPQNGQLREMSISWNDKIIFQNIQLQPQLAETYCNCTDSIEQDNRITISASENSQLPPILNGLELFAAKNFSNLPTTPDDGNHSISFSLPSLVLLLHFPNYETSILVFHGRKYKVYAMAEIKKQYALKKNWQGDPCLPKDYIWEGINCSDGVRVISLNLTESQLKGEIASSFYKLTEIESLDLSYNELTGQIPDFLAELPKLRYIVLTGNKLSGSIPEALLQKSEDGRISLSLDENPDLCLSKPCEKEKEKEKKTLLFPVVVSVAASLVLVLIILAIIFIFKRRKISGHLHQLQSGIFLLMSMINRLPPLVLGDIHGIKDSRKSERYSYSQVLGFTNNFSNQIGQGGFGKVYRGALTDGTSVAVKLLSLSSRQGYKEFLAEVKFLVYIHHRNLVSLRGYCDEGNYKILIYEFMENGNLEKYLSVSSPSFKQRLQIAASAAHGLEYLHNGCKPSIVHRDLKTANILLDGKMEAKISDFGLSRAIETGMEQPPMPSKLVGTKGYLCPEFATSGNLTKESDVYSFGVILFELITGRPALSRFQGITIHILDWAKPIIERGDIERIVDARFNGQCNKYAAWKVVDVAMSCTVRDPQQRPDMSDVLQQLKRCADPEIICNISTGNDQFMYAVSPTSDEIPLTR